jgi:hypothetical protein
MYTMKVISSSILQKMIPPRNGKLVTIDQLTYRDAQTQLHPNQVVCSLGRSQIIPSLSDIILEVYKDSKLLGVYYKNTPMITYPSSSSVCMVSSNHRPVGPHPQLSIGPSILTSSIPPPRAHPHPHYPFGQVPFLFPPLGIVNTLVMATLNLLNLTSEILVWYLEPPLNPLPRSSPTPYLDLNIV